MGEVTLPETDDDGQHLHTRLGIEEEDKGQTRTRLTNDRSAAALCECRRSDCCGEQRFSGGERGRRRAEDECPPLYSFFGTTGPLELSCVPRGPQEMMSASEG